MLKWLAILRVSRMLARHTEYHGITSKPRIEFYA